MEPKPVNLWRTVYKEESNGYSELQGYQFITVNNGSEVRPLTLFKSDTLRADLKSGGMLYLDADIGCLIAKIIEGGLLSAEGMLHHRK